MSPAIQLFLVLLVSGLVLIGAEIFAPGGILGLMGGVALLGAVLTAFTAFGTVPGAYIAVGIIFLAGAAVTIWIRFFPRSGIGRRMTVATDMASFKGTQDGLRELVGHEGEAASNLRPGGFAVINGKRIDVVTQGEMVLRGSKVRVLRVEGNRVVVERVAPPEKT